MTRYDQPYWWEGQNQPPPLGELPDQCDLLIVGAGYTGLSAAITAAQAGANVCVLDAQHPGFGASSRNGGMVGAHPRLSMDVLSKRYGHDVTHQIFNEANHAFDYFESLITNFHIDCDYQKTGRIQLAWTRADFASQQDMVRQITQKANFNASILHPEELEQHIHTSHYFGAIYYPDHGALQPYRFVQGLLKAALSLGTTVVDNCAVDTIKPDGTDFLVDTAKGSIHARKVLVATNGYTQGKTQSKGVIRWLARRIFPLPSYLMATEVLPQALINSLAPGGRMMVETRARHSYWRISPDGQRIIWGGRAAVRPIDLRLAGQRLHTTMAEIWPALRNTRITHVWTGNTGYTFNAMPHVGAVNGIHYAAGYCGGGVVMAPYLGMKAAYQALGDPRGATAYSATALATRPYYTGGDPWFLKPVDVWYNHVVDACQNRIARRDQDIS